MCIQSNLPAITLSTTDSQQSESPSLDFTKQQTRKILVAQWVMVDGKLICQWIIE
jgi:hypothetical protein